MIDKEVAWKFAKDWVESWNSHDVNRVLSHYSDDFEMTSPFIALMQGEPSGSLKGKDKVREYWEKALEKIPDLKFEIIDVLYSVNSIVIYYKAVLGKLGAEFLLLGEDGKVFKAIAHYDNLSIKLSVQQPTLQTQRLILRPFTLADAPDVQRLAGDRDIAATTLLIPHPYEDGMAEAWIQTHPAAFAERKAVTFAIAIRETEQLCGAMGLRIDGGNNNAELGYWIGKPYWGRGYCTEAAKAVLQYGFEVLQLHRIHASHFVQNPASGRVMQKIGMSYEGHCRQHTLKWGQYEDIKLYSILKSDWQQQIQPSIKGEF